MGPDTPLQNIFTNAPLRSRLKTRSPFYLSKKDNFNINDAWREEWIDKTPIGGDLINDPCNHLPGLLNLKRKYWTAANRLRSRHTRTAVNMHRWGLHDSPTCPRCHMYPQDTDHLVLHCPRTKLEGGYNTINGCEEDFQFWLDNLNLEV